MYYRSFNIIFYYVLYCMINYIIIHLLLQCTYYKEFLPVYDLYVYHICMYDYCVYIYTHHVTFTGITNVGPTLYTVG